MFCTNSLPSKTLDTPQRRLTFCRTSKIFKTYPSHLAPASLFHGSCPIPSPPAVHSPAVLGVVGLRTGADHHPPALDEGIFQQIAPQQWLLGGSSLFLANKNYVKLAIRRFLPMILGYQPANTFVCYMLPSGKLTLRLKIDHL